LEASFCHDTPGDKKERALYYEKTRKVIAKEIPDAGGLITNHLMVVFAIVVSLVLLWFVDEHTIDTSSKSINFLVEKRDSSKANQLPSVS
jgi:UDP-N-acetylmuramyl pentapeptide phosphotransferase/UDP-N-acetylglucosamine-1-phosphate transferase